MICNEKAEVFQDAIDVVSSRNAMAIQLLLGSGKVHKYDKITPTLMSVRSEHIIGIIEMK